MKIQLDLPDWVDELIAIDKIKKGKKDKKEVIVEILKEHYNFKGDRGNK